MKELSYKETLCTSYKIEYDSEKEMQANRSKRCKDKFIITKTKSIKFGKFIVTYIKYLHYNRGGG